MGSSANVIRTIRLGNDRIVELLNKIDETPGVDRPGESERKFDRYGYRSFSCVVEMQQPGAASPTAYYVIPRNIGAKGMAFLHGGYIHVGTTCSIQLVSTHGSWVDIKAQVIRCKFLEQNIHDVGVQFHQQIEPGEFCPDAIKTRVLLVDDDPTITKLITLFLQRLNTEVDHCENGQLAIEKTSEQVYDAVFMDLDMPVMDGLESTKKIREKGYTAPIIALTSMSSAEDIDKCYAMGCDKHLSKPITMESLSEVVNSLKREPLVSRFQNDSGMAPIIAEFVTSIPGRVKMIETAISANDLDILETTVRMLRAEGKSYGFDTISVAAGDIEHEIGTGIDLKSLSHKIQELVELCSLARGAH